MNKLLVGLVVGFFLGLDACIVAFYFVIVSGVIPARQDEPVNEFEKWAAHQSLRATMREQANLQCPLKADEENLLAGAKIYADNCSGCHGAPLAKNPPLASAYSPEAPLFASGDSVTDDPEGHIYWKIDHGVRFTGMPSFNRILHEKEMWQVALFLKHLDKLPAPVNDYWSKTK